MNASPPSRHAKPPQRRGHAGEVRIIGGLWKRSRLSVPDLPGLRPTPDRVRETVFNWLGQSLAGRRVLDLYAGSGALGLEAASRGAASVLLVEQHPRCVAAIDAAVQRLSRRPRAAPSFLDPHGGRVGEPTLGALKTGQVQVRAADALATAHTLARLGERFDVVFIDPPYAGGQQLAALAAAAPLLAAGGVVYVETDIPRLFDDIASQGWTIGRRSRAGQVHFALLQRGNSAAPETAPDAGSGTKTS